MAICEEFYLLKSFALIEKLDEELAEMSTGVREFWIKSSQSVYTVIAVDCGDVGLSGNIRPERAMDRRFCDLW